MIAKCKHGDCSVCGAKDTDVVKLKKDVFCLKCYRGIKPKKKELILDIKDVNGVTFPEIWVDVIGCDKKYRVSSYGRLISVNKTNSRIICPVTNKSGYLIFRINCNGKRVCIVAHKLVAIHYLPKPKFGKTQLNHIDAIKNNCHYSNLEWCTRKENIKHAVDMGLFEGRANHGEGNGRSTILTKLAKSIKYDAEINKGISFISRKYNVSWDIVSRIVKNKLWKHI